MSATIKETTTYPLRSGLSWAAIFGGAAVATAVTVMLTILGSGIGLAWISPSNNNLSPVAFTVTAAIWLIIVQWIASFFGGYLAGRLRPSLGGVHRDEVTFRDTASGFVAWAVTSIFILGLLGSGATSLIGSAGKATTAVVSSVVGGLATSSTNTSADPTEYLLDTLFRPDQPSPQADSIEAKAEAGRILATAVTGSISQRNHDYLVQMVTAQTGLSSADASKRVDQVIEEEQRSIEKAKKSANIARKAAAAFATYTFFSMLVGAFIACVAGAIGGRQRDAY